MKRTDKNTASSSMVPDSVAAREADYSSFEIIDDRGDNKGQRPGPKRDRKWSVAVLAVLLVGLAGTGFAMLVIDGEGDEAVSGDEVASEESGFQPYGGGGVAPRDNETSESGGAAEVTFADDDQSADDDDSSVRERPDQSEPRRRPLSRRDIDGEQVVEDTRGEAISQREAEDRLRRHADSLEDLEDEGHRRLRQRDVEQTSRVIQRRDGQLGVTPGIQVSDDVQRRIQEQFGEREMHAVGVTLEDYDGPEPRGEDYDDEYDDEYYDDEYYDEEYYDEEYYDDYDDY